MLIEQRQNSFLFGANAPYVEEQYERYLAEPASVTDEWRGYFDALRETPAVDGSDRDDEPHTPVVSSFVELARHLHLVAAHPDSALALARKQVAVQSLVAAFRTIGTRRANLDPLRWEPPRALPELTPAYHGLTAADIATRFSTADTYFFDGDTALAELSICARRTASVPEDHELHPFVNNMMAARRDIASGKKPIDWGTEEHLAFASLLGKGIDVRRSGQDCGRGTFNHGRPVLHNQKRTQRRWQVHSAGSCARRARPLHSDKQHPVRGGRASIALAYHATHVTANRSADPRIYEVRLT
jgi:2-oxoglutarate dehydrogenase complex dehydrogenase (E1) component-like enzyme